MALRDRINDLQTELQSINDKLTGLQSQAQPLQDRKQALRDELSDLNTIVKNRASFDAWKATQP